MTAIEIEKDGSVRCGQLCVCPSTQFGHFDQSSIFGGAKKVFDANGWCRYRINLEASVASLVFYDNQLLEVHLALVDPSLKGWSDWSEEREAQKKQQHDAILRQCLGNGPYQFDWGSVESIFDPKGGGSEIMIRYSPTANPPY